MNNLRIYQTAKDLVKETYVLISCHPKLLKDFALNDQLKRASISVVLNIAEGNARGTKQFKNYLRISSGSCNEVIAALEIINLIHDIDSSELLEKYAILVRQITAFSKSF